MLGTCKVPRPDVACSPPACLQGDFFTVEDLAYDYPTLNTL